MTNKLELQLNFDGELLTDDNKYFLKNQLFSYTKSLLQKVEHNETSLELKLLIDNVEIK